MESGYDRRFALSFRRDDVWHALEAAEQAVKAYTAEAEDWNDGEFALWHKDDLVKALVSLRQALG